MFTGAQDLISIGFSGSALKICHIKSSANHKEVANFLTRNISGLADADISKVIQATVSELKAKKPHIINVIPAHLVISKNIEVPSVDPDEIREIINLQASRHTPYSREEIIVDYINIGTYKNNYTKILLAIVAAGAIKKQFELLDKAGLKLEKALLAPEGIAWATSRILKTETRDYPVAVLHVDENYTDFTVVLRNKAVFIRAIPVGMQHLKNEKEKYETKFIEEIKKSLEAYQSEDIERAPNMLILAGAQEDSAGLERILSESLHLPVRMAPYLKNVTVSPSLLKDADTFKNLSFLDLIASALNFEEMKVDLTPEEIKLRKALEERGRDLIKAGIFSLALLALLLVILITKIYFKGAYLKEINVKFDSLNRQAEDLEKDFTKISLVRNYLFNRGYSLEVLTELYNAAPMDLELSDIRFDVHDRLTVRGTAESMSTVFSFVDSLEKSGYFKDVKTKYTTKRKESGKDFTDFEVTTLFDKEGQ